MEKQGGGGGALRGWVLLHCCLHSTPSSVFERLGRTEELSLVFLGNSLGSLALFLPTAGGQATSVSSLREATAAPFWG